MISTSQDAAAKTLERDEADGGSETAVGELSPLVSRLVGVGCTVLSALVLYRVFFPLSRGTHFYLTIFLAAVLPLIFIAHRGTVRVPAFVAFWRRGTVELKQAAADPGWLDWLLAVTALAAAAYPLLDFESFLQRRQLPSELDLVAGIVVVLLVLEACRRTVGWVLPLVCLGFLAYAYYGGLLPFEWSLAHQGFNVDEIVAQNYMSTSGLYGVPLDVAATYIVLFTIFGAVLELSGASRFFIELSMAAFRRSGSAPGRTTAAAGFLLGTVSGSGTATTVSLASVTWPILQKAGYPKDQAGGMLAAAGIGAILSPPTLGAAAFIIAEYLNTSYLTVLVYALVPTILYYTGIALAIEIDARKHATRQVRFGSGSPLRLLARSGYHFLPLVLIVVFMARDIPPFKAVVYATGIQLVLSFLDREHRLTPRRLYQALDVGTRSVLPVAATCAAAGTIVAVVTQTGLGLNLAEILTGAASAVGDDPTTVLVLTTVLSALAVSILGLAVPVTASFIISVVIIAPALLALGVERAEAYMFIFYYAVLAEVTPPTALAAVAAAAITGGHPLKTMMATFKYTLPAFLVPFAFVLTDNGQHLLAKGSLLDVGWTLAVAMAAVAALAAATGGWLLGPASVAERLLSLGAAILLLYLSPTSVGVGALLFAAALGINFWRTAGSGRSRQLPEPVPQAPVTTPRSERTDA